MSIAGLGLVGPDVTATVPMVLAQPSPKPEDPGGRGEDFGKSSPVGFLVLILFFVAVAFLIRSMTKHLKRVPASFDPPADGADEGPAEPDTDAPPATPKPKPNGDPKPA